MARIFTQKHYVAIAQFIVERKRHYASARQASSQIILYDLTDAVVDMFKADSSKFDEGKFRATVGHHKAR